MAGATASVGLYVNGLERIPHHANPVQSLQLPARARALTAAGREPGRASLVAYRLGRGLVIRLGTPQWSRRIGPDPEVATVTRKVWALLSR